MVSAFKNLAGTPSKTFLQLALLLALLHLSLGLQELEVYRLVSYEENNQAFGSKLTSFNLVASHFSGDLLRKLAVIQFEEITEENLFATLQKRASGLLIMLPEADIPAAKEQAVWKVISHVLVSRKIEIPVYFSRSSHTASTVYEKLKAAAAGKLLADESKLHFILKSDEPSLLNNLQLEDFNFILDDSVHPSKFSASTNPLILLVASWDSFSLVPDLSLGFNQHASGAAGLVYIAKHLSKLRSQNPKVKYNVLFYLTSASNFKYEGLQLWLNKAENAKIVGKIEYAIFLNSIASEQDLKLYLLNTEVLNPENSYQIFQKLNQTSNAFNKNVKIVSTSETMFSQRFPVLKFSCENNAAEGEKEYGSLDLKTFDKSLLTTNLLFLTEFLTNTIYNITTSTQIFDKESLDSDYLNALVEFFRTRPRALPLITRESDFSKELFSVLQTTNRTVNKIYFTYNQPKYYSSKPATIQIIKSSSAFLEIYIFCGVVAWLFALYFVLHSFSNSKDSEHKKD